MPEFASVAAAQFADKVVADAVTSSSAVVPSFMVVVLGAVQSTLKPLVSAAVHVLLVLLNNNDNTCPLLVLGLGLW